MELIHIRAFTTEEVSEKLMVLLTSGIALSKQTVADIMTLSDFIDKNKIDEIKNREVKIALYKKYNIVPKNPEEFLRYLIFVCTGNTLKIQDVNTINSIKRCERIIAIDLFENYNKLFGYNKLSSIFLRNKNLFLAFKVQKRDYETKIETENRKKINYIINKLRKLANKNHKPLSPNVLDNISNTLSRFTSEFILEALDNVTIFRELRILNGLLYRLSGSNDMLYKIRNGKAYYKKIEIKGWEYSILKDRYKLIYNHLINRLSKKIKGKTIYIPKNVCYAVPTSEKQFNGNFPNGSYIEIPRDGDLIYGIHWTNLPSNKKSNTEFYGEYNKNEEERVDLDLHQMNNSQIFGWNSNYRDERGNILFSGDITDAPSPKGATELFYVDKNYGYGAFSMSVNMYTHNSQDVPFEFVIAKSDHNINERVNYVINPNNILEKINMTMSKDQREKNSGLIVIGDTIKLYLNDFSTGNRCATKQDEVTKGTFSYLQTYSKVQLKLNDLLKIAGAILTDQPTITGLAYMDDKGEIIESYEKPVDYDLSPNNITKETIIDLLSD